MLTQSNRKINYVFYGTNVFRTTIVRRITSGRGPKEKRKQTFLEPSYIFSSGGRHPAAWSTRSVKILLEDARKTTASSQWTKKCFPADPPTRRDEFIDCLGENENSKDQNRHEELESNKDTPLVSLEDRIWALRGHLMPRDIALLLKSFAKTGFYDERLLQSFQKTISRFADVSSYLSCLVSLMLLNYPVDDMINELYDKIENVYEILPFNDLRLLLTAFAFVISPPSCPFLRETPGHTSSEVETMNGQAPRLTPPEVSRGMSGPAAAQRWSHRRRSKTFKRRDVLRLIVKQCGSDRGRISSGPGLPTDHYEVTTADGALRNDIREKQDFKQDLRVTEEEEQFIMAHLTLSRKDEGCGASQPANVSTEVKQFPEQSAELDIFIPPELSTKSEAIQYDDGRLKPQFLRKVMHRLKQRLMENMTQVTHRRLPWTRETNKRSYTGKKQATAPLMHKALIGIDSRDFLVLPHVLAQLQCFDRFVLEQCATRISALARSRLPADPTDVLSAVEGYSRWFALLRGPLRRPDFVFIRDVVMIDGVDVVGLRPARLENAHTAVSKTTSSALQNRIKGKRFGFDLVKIQESPSGEETADGFAANCLNLRTICERYARHTLAGVASAPEPLETAMAIYEKMLARGMSQIELVHYFQPWRIWGEAVAPLLSPSTEYGILAELLPVFEWIGLPVGKIHYFMSLQETLSPKKTRLLFEKRYPADAELDVNPVLIDDICVQTTDTKQWKALNDF